MYRDDHAAALARIDALEAELARERGQTMRALQQLYAERSRPLAAPVEARVVVPPRTTRAGWDRGASAEGLKIWLVCTLAMIVLMVSLVAPFYLVVALITGHW